MVSPVGSFNEASFMLDPQLRQRDPQLSQLVDRELKEVWDNKPRQISNIKSILEHIRVELLSAPKGQEGLSVITGRKEFISVMSRSVSGAAADCGTGFESDIESMKKQIEELNHLADSLLAQINPVEKR